MNDAVVEHCYLASWMLVVEDLQASLDFYCRLGFEKKALVGDGAWVLGMHGFRLDLWDCRLIHGEPMPLEGQPLRSHLLLRVIDEAAFTALEHHVREAGLEIAHEPHRDPASRRRMVLRDPDGNVVEILEEELLFRDPGAPLPSWMKL